MELAVATPPVLRSWMYGPLLLDRAYGYSVAPEAPTSSAATPPPARPFGALPWCFFHGMFSVGDETSPAREVTAEHLLGSADWSQSPVMRHAFGLHMHGLPGGGRRAEPGSVMSVLGARTLARAARRGIDLPVPSRKPQARSRATDGVAEGEGLAYGLGEEASGTSADEAALQE